MQACRPRNIGTMVKKGWQRADSARGLPRRTLGVVPAYLGCRLDPARSNHGLTAEFHHSASRTTERHRHSRILLLQVR